MPGFVTHYLFGVNVFQGLPNGSIKNNLRKNHAAFALGLQGPDVFFYYLPSYLLHQKNLGALAHDHATDRFFPLCWKAAICLQAIRFIWESPTLI